MGEEAIQEESLELRTAGSYETFCWGCGLRVLLPSYSSIFQCGWCGAITKSNHRERKPDGPCFARWRRSRDRLFTSIVLLFMSFVIGGGLWAIYPIVFGVSDFCGIFHYSVASLMSVCTVSSFLLASLSSPGEPAAVKWGDYGVVRKGSLEDFTLCSYCSRPKPPRAHHCRSCGICVVDMDHHCPFIGNCVGGRNHRYFVWFLISGVISCAYIITMAAFAWHKTWPPLDPRRLSTTLHISNSSSFFTQTLIAIANAAFMLSPRELLLLYLGVSSLSILIGIAVLLWQQLSFIYEGQTYLTKLSSAGYGEKGCHNILRFFGCPYWAHKPNNSKLL